MSVHATEPALRERLLVNPRAGLLMQQLDWFAERDLQIHFARSGEPYMRIDAEPLGRAWIMEAQPEDVDRLKAEMARFSAECPEILTEPRYAEVTLLMTHDCSG